MVRFRLVKVGEAALEPSATPDPQAAVESASVPAEPRPFPSDAFSGARDEVSRVTDWAGIGPTRWKQLHETLLRMYAPVWERVDSRDILVAWAGAWLALTQAKHELARLEAIRPPLTKGECAAKGGRQADVSFWGRVTRHLQAQVPVALAEDVAAAKVLVALMNKTQRSTHE